MCVCVCISIYIYILSEIDREGVEAGEYILQGRIKGVETEGEKRTTYPTAGRGVSPSNPR